jgi:hypothetical protein
VADPKGLKQFPPGVKLAPIAIDAVPSDWADVDYTITIVAHPDLPDQPILKFVVATNIAAQPQPVIEDDGTGVYGFVVEGGELVYETP